MLARYKSSRARYTEYLRNHRATRNYIDEPVDDTGKRRAKRKRARSFLMLLRELWKLLREHRVTVVLALMTLTFSVAVGLTMPSATKIAIDYVMTDHPGPAGIPSWLPIPDSWKADRIGLLWRVGVAMVSLSLFSVLIGMW